MSGPCLPRAIERGTGATRTLDLADGHGVACSRGSIRGEAPRLRRGRVPSRSRASRSALVPSRRPAGPGRSWPTARLAWRRTVRTAIAVAELAIVSDVARAAIRRSATAAIRMAVRRAGGVAEPLLAQLGAPARGRRPRSADRARCRPHGWPRRSCPSRTNGPARPGSHRSGGWTMWCSRAIATRCREPPVPGGGRCMRWGSARTRLKRRTFPARAARGRSASSAPPPSRGASVMASSARREDPVSSRARPHPRPSAAGGVGAGRRPARPASGRGRPAPRRIGWSSCPAARSFRGSSMPTCT